MLAEKLARIQSELTELAILSLDIVDLDRFVERIDSPPISQVVPAGERNDLRELALAVANLQRVAVKQLVGGVAA